MSTSYKPRTHLIRCKASGRYFQRIGENGVFAPLSLVRDDSTFFLAEEVQPAAVSFYGDSMGLEDKYTVETVTVEEWQRIMASRGGKSKSAERVRKTTAVLQKVNNFKVNCWPYLKEWLKDLKERGISTDTIEEREQKLQDLKYFINDEPVWHENFKRWIIHLAEDRKRATVDRYRVAAVLFFNWLKEKQHAPEHWNPAPRECLKLMGPVDPVDRCGCGAITEAEHEAITAEACRSNHYWEYAVRVGWGTGLRLGDIATLKVSDIDFDNLVIRRLCNKTTHAGKVAEVPITPELAGFLNGCVDERKGKHVNQDMFEAYTVGDRAVLSAQFTLLARRAKVAKTFHGYRRAFITRLLEKGVTAEIVSSITGQDLPTVMRYARIGLDTKRAAVSKINGVKTV